MLKALKCPPTHPILFQLSLLDGEFDTLLAFRSAVQDNASKRHRYLRRGEGRGGNGNEDSHAVAVTSGASEDGNIDGEEEWTGPSGATQQPINDGDDCPICLDPLDNPSKPITFCRPSCGNNLHLQCILEYAEHAAKSSHSPESYGVKCLLCRAPWGLDALPWLRRSWAAARRRLQSTGETKADGALGSEVHKNSRCSGCHAKPISGAKYVCVRCSPRVDLCSDCFGRGRHAQHPFVVTHEVGGAWTPAPRVGGNQQVWRPVAPLAGANGGQGLSEAALVALQTRELGPNDYDLLLMLDQGRQPRAAPTMTMPSGPSQPLGAFLAETLAVATVPPEQASCAHCGQILSMPSPNASQDVEGAAAEPHGRNKKRLRPRKYPCEHTVHLDCAAAAVETPSSQEGSTRSNFVCPVGACATPIYPGLFRKPRPVARSVDPPPSTAPATQSIYRTPHAHASGLGDGFALAGTAVSSTNLHARNGASDTTPAARPSGTRATGQSLRDTSRAPLALGGGVSAAEDPMLGLSGLQVGTSGAGSEHRAAAAGLMRGKVAGSRLKSEASSASSHKPSADDMTFLRVGASSSSVDEIAPLPNSHHRNNGASSSFSGTTSGSSKGAQRALAAKAARDAMMQAEAAQAEADLAEKLARHSARRRQPSSSTSSSRSSNSSSTGSSHGNLAVAPAHRRPSGLTLLPPPTIGEEASQLLPPPPAAVSETTATIVLTSPSPNAAVTRASSTEERSRLATPREEQANEGTQNQETASVALTTPNDGSTAAQRREARRSEALAALRQRQHQEVAAAETSRLEAERRRFAQEQLEPVVETANSAAAVVARERALARDLKLEAAAARRRSIADAERARNHSRIMARTEMDAAVERRRVDAIGARSRAHADPPIPQQGAEMSEVERAASTEAAPVDATSSSSSSAASEVALPAEPAAAPSVFLRRAVEAHASEVQRRRDHRRREEAKEGARLARANARHNTSHAAEASAFDQLVIGSAGSGEQQALGAMPSMRATRSAPMSVLGARRQVARSRTPGEAPRQPETPQLGLEIEGKSRISRVY